MKFKIKKNSFNSDVHKSFKIIEEFINKKIQKGFYSKDKKHYVNNLTRDFIVEVKIK